MLLSVGSSSDHLAVVEALVGHADSLASTNSGVIHSRTHFSMMTPTPTRTPSTMYARGTILSCSLASRCPSANLSS